MNKKSDFKEGSFWARISDNKAMVVVKNNGKLYLMTDDESIPLSGANLEDYMKI